MIFRNLGLSIALIAFSSFAMAGKIAVFNHEQAIMQTKHAESIVKELQAKPEYSSLMAQIESLRADLQGLAKEQETKGMTWSGERQAEHRKKIEYVQADMQLAAKKIQAEQNTVAKRLMEDMAPKLESAIKKIVDSEDIDVLLKVPAVYYVKPDLDITKKVAVELDKAK
ncbi:MAG: OmpH family outer membrane protein [Cellvibrionaceae bacterium]|nr:OmpH family outer membrane protein [Cellvibrionaceae bacterium]